MNKALFVALQASCTTPADPLIRLSLMSSSPLFPWVLTALMSCAESRPTRVQKRFVSCTYFVPCNLNKCVTLYPFVHALEFMARRLVNQGRELHSKRTKTTSKTVRAQPDTSALR